MHNRKIVKLYLLKKWSLKKEAMDGDLGLKLELLKIQEVMLDYYDGVGTPDVDSVGC